MIKFRHFLLSMSFVFVTSAALAQLPNGVTMIPGNATGADLITLVIDPTLICTPAGQTPLSMVDSISIHSGVNGWQNVIAWDATPAGGGKLNTTLLKNADSKFVMTFRPNDYYGATANEINFVLNQGATDPANPWTSEGKDTDANGNCADFRITLFATSVDNVNANDYSVKTFPNPFAGTTNIKYALTSNDFVSVKVFNAIGQEVSTLVNQDQYAGSYSVVWDGTNQSGAIAPKGTYFLQVKTTNGSTVTSRMVKID